ncbi:MAG: sigma-70 family RNA polymerase sigma factor [Steroidobacteraceae bacterium]
MEPISTVDSSDRCLVLRAQSGDREAFNLLVRKYRHRVMKLTMRFMRNRADAEDTVQDIFLRAYGSLRHFRGDSAFYSWLHRIALNSAKSAHKTRIRNARRFLVGADAGGDPTESSAQTKDLDSPEHLAMTDEICAAVNNALDALCHEQRTAISLREFDGLSYAEVAAAMSSPVGTVRSRVFRAREAIDLRLRRVFDDGLGRARNSRPGYTTGADRADLAAADGTAAIPRDVSAALLTCRTGSRA